MKVNDPQTKGHSECVTATNIKVSSVMKLFPKPGDNPETTLYNSLIYFQQKDYQFTQHLHA